MKIFTIDRSGVHEGAKVERVETPQGYIIPVIAVGEIGRGRQRSEIPIRLQVDAWNELRKKGEATVKEVDIVRTRLGDIRFEESYTRQLVDEYLVVFYGWIGFRGWNRLEMADGQPVPEEMVIARGRIAQGEAGLMGSGEQWILKLHHGDLLRYEVGGRLYGEPSTYIVVAGQDKPILYTEEMYKLGRIYDA